MSSTPADDATGIAVADDIVLTFDEAVVAGTGRIDLFDAADPTTPLASTLTFAGDTVTIDPDADLANDTDYFVRVQATAVEDAAGNAFAGFTDPTALNFTTAADTGDLTEVSFTNFDDPDAGDGAYQFNVDMPENDVYSGLISNFGDDDVINIDDADLATDNLAFDTTGTSEIDFAFGGGIADETYIPAFIIAMTGLDATLVAAVEAAADSVEVMGILDAEWGGDWLI